MLKKFKLATGALFAALLLMTATPARADVQFGISIGPPVYAYPVNPYVYSYPYSTPYPYPYYSAPRYVYPAPYYSAPNYRQRELARRQYLERLHRERQVRRNYNRYWR